MDLNKVSKRNEEAWFTWVDFDLEYDMLLEEAEETEKAKAENDIVEIMDGYLDVIFVAQWTLYKLWIVARPPIWAEDADIRNFIQNRKIAYEKEQRLTVSSVCSHAISMSMGYLYKNFPRKVVDECFNEVCDSNMSKLPFKKDKNGKVKKWPNFFRPKIEEILKREWIIK